MSADWRVYAIAILFGLYLGWLGGTRRGNDRRDAVISLVVAFGVGFGFLIFGAGDDASALAATSLIVGPPVAILGIIAWAARTD